MSAKGKEAAPRFPEIPPEQVPETFTLRQGKTMLAMGVIVLVAFGGTTAWSAVSSGELQLNMLGICVLSVLAGLVILAKYRNHRLERAGISAWRRLSRCAPIREKTQSSWGKTAGCWPGASAAWKTSPC